MRDVPHNLERDEAPPCGGGHEFRQSNKCDGSPQALFELDRLYTTRRDVFRACLACVTYDSGGTKTKRPRDATALEWLHVSTL